MRERRERHRGIPGQQRRVCEDFTGPPDAAEQACRGGGSYGRPPDVYRILGLKDGEAHVIRNAGESSPTTRSAAGHQPATARYQGDHPHPPHRLRHADVHRRRLQTRSAGRDRYQAGVGRRVVPRRRRGRSPVLRRIEFPARSSPNTSRCVGSSSMSRPANSTRSFAGFPVVPTPCTSSGRPTVNPHGHHGSTGRRRQSRKPGTTRMPQEHAEVQNGGCPRHRSLTGTGSIYSLSR